MSKHEAIEPRNSFKKLKPILSSLKQATSHISTIARDMGFNRGRSAWRAYAGIYRNRRDPILSACGTNVEFPERRRLRMEYRKSDKFIVVKKPGNSGGAKGLEQNRVINELLTQIIG